MNRDHTALQRRRPTNEERARELDVLEREAAHARRRLHIETLLGCLLCCAVGLLLVSWALHTTDARWAGVSFWTGLLIGDVGMVTLMMRHYHRSEEAG